MKKGFTLVELLAVITVLGILAFVIVPKAISLISTSKIKTYNEQVTRIEEAAELYATEKSYDLVYVVNTATITLGTLIDEGYIEEPIKNPITTNDFDRDLTTIQIVKSGNLYSVTAYVADMQLDKSGANVPQLVKGLIPVYWNETAKSWAKADKRNTDAENKWYDYDNHMWANAVTVVDYKRDAYTSAEVGALLSDSYFNAMFVWIPRYAYRIAAGSGAREIEISFETVSTPKSLGNAVTSFRTLPGFSFGSSELSGLWIGKFQTTGGLTSPRVEADASSFDSANNKAFFDSVKNEMQGSADFGFGTDSDIHMSKSTEYATMVYLTGSKYGKYGNSDYVGANKEVYLNNGSSSLNYTGRSSGSPSGAGVLTPTTEYILYGYYKYDYRCASIYAGLGGGCDVGSTGQQTTDRLLSDGASSTGTIYGVYDISGGVWDRTMGLYKPDPIPATGISDLSGFSTLTTDSQYDLLTIDPKYYDVYKTGDSTTACDGFCYGHAMSGTADWYGDQSGMVSGGYPWVTRGGIRSGGTIAGTFAYAATSGTSSSTSSFRITLVSN